MTSESKIDFFIDINKINACQYTLFGAVKLSSKLVHSDLLCVVL
jgi:hypothetical protein